MTAVHVAMLDVAPHEMDQFDYWYREQYLPTVVARPGWRSASVYACTTATNPDFLVLLDVDLEAVEVPACVPPFAHEGEFGRATIHNYEGETFALTQRAGAFPESHPLINLIVTQVDTQHADDFDRWYRDEHVPDILRCPGWWGVQRFRSVDRGGRFLAMYAVEDETRPFNTPEYRDAVGWDDHAAHLLGYHGFRLYRLRYVVDEESRRDAGRHA